MARIIYSGLVTNIRGSVGGTTFQQNAFGFSIKNKPAMSRIASVKQNEQRRRLNYVAQGWLAITDAQRASWVAWALSHPTPSNHNPSSILSGYQYFLKYNLAHTMWVSTYLAAPNAGVLILPSIAPTIVRSGAALNVDLHAAFDEVLIYANYYMSPPQPVTHTFSNSKTRAIDLHSLSAGAFDVAVSYLNAFGSLPSSGDTLFFEVQPFGASNPYIYTSQYFTLIVG